MQARKLRDVASSPALRDWAQSCPDGMFPGTSRVETRHATYLFRNGSCFAVSGRGPRGGTTSTEMVGMRLAGWLLPEDDAALDSDTRRRIAAGGIRVSRNFRPGARAVLHGKPGLLGGVPMAVTSPVDTFCLYRDPSTPELRPPSFDRSPTGSHTRVDMDFAAIG